MPKTSAIQRNEKRKRLVEKYAKVRAELKAVLANPATTDEQFFAAQTKLQKLPKNSSRARIRNRCSMLAWVPDRTIEKSDANARVTSFGSSPTSMVSAIFNIRATERSKSFAS